MKKLLLLLLLATPALASGELMVHPTRVVFDGATRTAQIDVINSGTEPMTYRISVIRRRMTPTGDFVEVDTPQPGEQFAAEMIRYSPRQVVLQPGVAQAVRLQLRKPADLSEGEYRSHLLFQALPAATPPPAPDEAQSKELDIRLTAVYSVSIPVIVRHGATAASVSIRDVELRRDKTPAAALTIERSGTRSVYGDLVVYLRGASGPERIVGRANGVAVYTPNDTRRVILPLPALEKGIPPGELRVAFTERREQQGAAAADARIAVR